jgi:phytoene dehydrogenase-like protein
MSDRIERQIERFAPGFRDLVLERRSLSPAELERRNGNYIGGDITGGSNNAMQLFFRPRLMAPYRIPVRGVGWYLCSASTPPGGGVHGMCGYHAAREALRHLSTG